ncbi:MAG TPA: hypothetical protein VEB22_13445 [Phycisphaerales bacterium]|nr:hypothetical protein [Phycisphaerales bacterium]
MVGDFLQVDERVSARRAVLEEIERTQPELLSAEFRTLRRRFQELYRQHPDQYVAIKGEQIVGVWASFDEADRGVYEKYPHQTVAIVKLDAHADLPAAIAVDYLGEVLRRGDGI